MSITIFGRTIVFLIAIILVKPPNSVQAHDPDQPATVSPSISSPGVLLGGPKEGDIKLKDASGRWIGVRGIPLPTSAPAANSVRIAIVDSGVAMDHPQLRGRILAVRDFTGEGIDDRIGHGTIISILTRAPERPGVPPPWLLIAKVAKSDGSIDPLRVIAAIKWSIRNKVSIVNLSLGFESGTGDFSKLCGTIASASSVVFVAAAGNSGSAVRYYPAVCKTANIVSVGTPDSWSGSGDIVTSGDTVLEVIDAK